MWADPTMGTAMALDGLAKHRSQIQRFGWMSHRWVPAPAGPPFSAFPVAQGPADGAFLLRMLVFRVPPGCVTIVDDQPCH